jgi:hypothetical protein
MRPCRERAAATLGLWLFSLGLPVLHQLDHRPDHEHGREALLRHLEDHDRGRTHGHERPRQDPEHGSSSPLHQGPVLVPAAALPLPAPGPEAQPVLLPEPPAAPDLARAARPSRGPPSQP